MKNTNSCLLFEYVGKKTSQLRNTKLVRESEILAVHNHIFMIEEK